MILKGVHLKQSYVTIQLQPCWCTVYCSGKSTCRSLNDYLNKLLFKHSSLPTNSFVIYPNKLIIHESFLEMVTSWVNIDDMQAMNTWHLLDLTLDCHRKEKMHKNVKSCELAISNKN